MRIKTLVLIPLIALLGGSAIHADATTLPMSQSQTSANAPQTKKVVPSTKPTVSLDYRTVESASRSASRYPYASKAYNKKYAQVLMKQKYGWKNKQYSCLVKLWNRESGWRVNAHNPSGAHGIPQALPGKKMGSAGPNWRSNPHTQIKWGLKYIKGRYSTPCSALGHSNRHNWY
jgi:hypothetical protein